MKKLINYIIKLLKMLKIYKSCWKDSLTKKTSNKYINLIDITLTAMRLKFVNNEIYFIASQLTVDH